MKAVFLLLIAIVLASYDAEAKCLVDVADDRMVHASIQSQTNWKIPSMMITGAFQECVQYFKINKKIRGKKEITKYCKEAIHIAVNAKLKNFH